MAIIMMVEKIKYKWYGLILGISIVYLIAMVLFGILGPQARLYEISSAYSCPNDSHVWDNQTCSGTQLGEGNSQYWHELPPLTKLNSLWKLVIYPYNINPSPQYEVNEELQVSLGIFCKGGEDDGWVSLATQTLVNTSLFCSTKEEECVGITLIFVDSVNYPYYAVRVSFPNTDENANAKSNIGDVSFQFEWGNEDYAIEEIVVRLIYFIIALGLFSVFLFRLNKMDFSIWSIEQRLNLILLLSLMFLNNPIYGLEFIMPGSFLPLLDCFFIVVQQTSLLLIWLVLFDYIRKGKLSIELNKFDIIKPLAVSLYALMSFVLYAWFQLEEINNPILGEQSKSFSYFLLLFVITGIIYCGILLWVAMLMIFTVQKIRKEKGVFFNRFLVIGTATIIMIISMVVNLLFGNIGPIHQKAISFMYFYGVTNLYIWVLTFSFWPVESNKQSTSAPVIVHSRETTPIFPHSFENSFVVNKEQFS